MCTRIYAVIEKSRHHFHERLGECLGSSISTLPACSECLLSAADFFKQFGPRSGQTERQKWYRGELHAGLCVVSLLMIVFQTCLVILGRGLLRIGVQTPDYVCFIRLCMVLLQYHYHHMLCILRCLQDIQHHIH